MRTMILLSVCVFVACAILASASAQPITSPYIFPKSLGTPAWKSLNTFADKLTACQIPQDTLQRLTTESLVQTCLDYPMFLNYTAYTDSLGGMATVISGFNGMQELLRRKDAGSCLLKKYFEFDPTTYTRNWTDDKIAGFSLRLAGMERLLGHYSILANLQVDERRDLLSLAVDRLRKMILDSRYGAFDAEASAWLAGRVMLVDNVTDFLTALKSNPRLSAAMARCMFLGKEGMDEISLHASKFLSSKP